MPAPREPGGPPVAVVAGWRVRRAGSARVRASGGGVCCWSVTCGRSACEGRSLVRVYTGPPRTWPASRGRSLAHASAISYALEGATPSTPRTDECNGGGVQRWATCSAALRRAEWLQLSARSQSPARGRQMPTLACSSSCSTSPRVGRLASNVPQTMTQGHQGQTMSRCLRIPRTVGHWTTSRCSNRAACRPHLHHPAPQHSHPPGRVMPADHWRRPGQRVC